LRRIVSSCLARYLRILPAKDAELKHSCCHTVGVVARG
jgi:hypothetical protein